MTDIVTIGRGILEAGSGAALIGLLAVLAIPQFKKKIFGNGNYKPEEMAGKVAEHLVENHFHEMINDIKDLKRWQEEENKILTEAVLTLRDIKDGLRK